MTVRNRKIVARSSMLSGRQERSTATPHQEMKYCSIPATFPRKHFLESTLEK